MRGASAYYVQKPIAPPKQAVCRFSDEKLFDENLDQAEDFEFNQDFEIDDKIKSPGWIRYQKRLK